MLWESLTAPEFRGSFPKDVAWEANWGPAVSPDMVQGVLDRALLWLALMLVEIGLKLEFRHIGI